jgi:hypothetical protein
MMAHAPTDIQLRFEGYQYLSMTAWPAVRSRPVPLSRLNQTAVGWKAPVFSGNIFSHTRIKDGITGDKPC